ncbi:DUF438 domain-containing protein [uncultured Selenomonas sp.]|uniref:DUF438 domain-containing protein n=1 Tax=uncultured Selenomonas sp. TaxID=159275 RepID=UPI0028DCF52D|nr:DUF438 domain-containing protein [uncultured Selenomonas sp.]
MKKELDLKKTVAELVEEFPEFRQAMAEIGFKEIMNPVALNVMGRVMTLPAGVAVKGLKLEDVVRELEARGFSVKGVDAPAEACGGGGAEAHDGCGCAHVSPAADAPLDAASQERAAALKGFLQRLSAGESLDEVRKDFIKDFASVSAEEISAAEQQLIEGGTPIHEVQKLCDVHSALFHGHIGGTAPTDAAPEVQELAEGHPLTVLNRENQGLTNLLDRLTAAVESGDAAALGRGLGELNGLYSHYGKKESLLMTLLYRYGVTGPSGVMWGVDDEIKQELRALTKSLADGIAGQEERFSAFFQRIRDMIYKEEQILFPLTLRFFSAQDWLMIYRDMPEFGVAFIEGAPKWPAGDVYVAEAEAKERAMLASGRLRLSTGEIGCRELEAILKLLPVDITYIDKDEMLRFFSNPGQVFARPRLALGSKVYNCHPVNIVPIIEQLVADFKAKKRDRMEIYRYIKGKPVGVRYLAVYDEDGEYTGAVELVEDFSEALKQFGAKQ